jgi:hypothetical protein
MRVALPELTVAAFILRCAVCAGQYPANAQRTGAPVTASQYSAGAPPVAAPAPSAGPSASQILQPALDQLQGTLNGIRTDKWKKGSIRDEAGQNITQIMRDVQVNLPPLLHGSDAAPGSVSKMLPVSKNVGALYDVLLRVVEASRVVGPDDQVKQLQQALVSLGNARLALDDRMQAAAESTEKVAADLRTTMLKDAAHPVAVPVPVVIPCAAPAHRTTRRPAKTAKPSPSTPSATNGSKPNSPTQNSH